MDRRRETEEARKRLQSMEQILPLDDMEPKTEEEEGNMVTRALRGALEKLKTMGDNPLEYKPTPGEGSGLKQQFDEGMEVQERNRRMLEDLFPKR